MWKYEKNNRKQIQKIDRYNMFDDSYLQGQDDIIRPKDKVIIQEIVEKKGRPSLVIMDMA